MSQKEWISNLNQWQIIVGNNQTHALETLVQWNLRWWTLRDIGTQYNIYNRPLYKGHRSRSQNLFPQGFIQDFWLGWGKSIGASTKRGTVRGLGHPPSPGPPEKF